MDNRLQFHDRIIKTGKGESKFAIRYNIHGVSPYMGTKWNYNAKSVSIPPYDNKLICGADYCGEEFGIYAVEIGDFFLKNNSPYIQQIKMPFVDVLLLEYTEDDVLHKRPEEISLRQCNIVYVCDNLVSIYRMFKYITNKFQKIKEAAEYNTYF
ncbi:MAG: hypothetical protein J6M40_02550 [Prevotella sp.]|nr:hypothetical protein [Prevotella sp.]